MQIEDIGEWDQRSVPDPALAALISIRQWSDLRQLASFASARHGFGNSDSGCGIHYPDDLDEYAREVDGMVIPDGHVLAYGFWGANSSWGGYDVLVPEETYRAVLAAALTAAGFEREAAEVRALGAGGAAGA